jgi:hypothetical protein
MDRIRASPGGSLSHSMHEMDSAAKHRIDASGASSPLLGVSMSLDKGGGLLRRVPTSTTPNRCSDDAEVIHDKDKVDERFSNDGMLFGKVDSNISGVGKKPLTLNQ